MKLNDCGSTIEVQPGGYVRLEDIWGKDSDIARAARVSYGSGTKSIREDTGLINHLLRNGHTSPFEMVGIKFHIRAPIFVARQFVRHRMSNWNEYSGRFSEMIDECYVPPEEDIRIQDSANKQGSSGINPNAAKIVEIMENVRSTCQTAYSELLAYECPREQARIVLPVANFTEWYWRFDLNNLIKMLALRLDSHTQYETRMFAEAICLHFQRSFPIGYAAFIRNIVRGARLTGPQMDAIREALALNEINREEFGEILKKHVDPKSSEFSDTMRVIYA